MANTPNRKCVICGEKYYYCKTCRDSNPGEPWRNIYHDRNCMDVANIWYAYRGKEITNDEAKSRMEKYSETMERVKQSSTPVANGIKELCGFVIPIEEEVIVEEITPVVEDVVVEETPIEDKPSDEVVSTKQNNSRSKKK